MVPFIWVEFLKSEYLTFLSDKNVKNCERQTIKDS